MTLIDLTPFLDDVIDSFAAVLDLELTVINAKPLVRVSGTGKFKGHVRDDWEHTYTRQVLCTGQPMTALDTSAHSFSIVEGRQQEYYSLILYPITVGGEIEGVVVLASFTEQQQSLLIERNVQLLDYLAKTASLISAKLAQEQLLELATTNHAQLSAVFESVKGGLLLYVAGGQILQINDRARQLLRVGGEVDFAPGVLEEVFGIAEQALATQQTVEQYVSHRFAAGSLSLVVQARPVRGNAQSAVCVINPFQDLQNTITQNGNEGIPFELIGRDSAMLSLKESIRQVAQHSSNVLILGESGTGKELVARAIHRASPRKANPFVTVNCAAIPETLLESELFGYEEGAFTGAKKGGRIGKFLLADTGTLFLDEIGDMPLYLQAKLLRALSDRMIDRVGSSHPVPVDIHIIAATNRNLEQMIVKQEFREDLYYRLSVIPLSVPPLRERRGDILLLVEHFIEKYNAKLGKQIAGISPRTRELLCAYDWPGNVRELENCVEYMVNFERGPLLAADNIPRRIATAKPAGAGTAAASFPPPPEQGSLRGLIRHCEAQAISRHNARYGGHPSLTEIKAICVELGISVSSYYRKMEELGLQFNSGD